MKAGILGSVLGLACLAPMASYIFGVLTTCGHLGSALPEWKAKQRLHPPTFPEIGDLALGVFGRVITWIGLWAFTLGAVGTYFVFISQGIVCAR
eukprot:scaffold1129_cov376-Prasinococcus_capsulatus_cf.AAC.11